MMYMEANTILQQVSGLPWTGNATTPNKFTNNLQLVAAGPTRSARFPLPELHVPCSFIPSRMGGTSVVNVLLAVSMGFHCHRNVTRWEEIAVAIKHGSRMRYYPPYQ